MKAWFLTGIAMMIGFVVLFFSYIYLVVERFPPIEDAEQLVRECRELMIIRNKEERYSRLYPGDFPPEIRRLDPHSVWLRGDYVRILLGRRHYVSPVYIVFIGEDERSGNIEDHWMKTDHPLIYRNFMDKE